MFTAFGPAGAGASATEPEGGVIAGIPGIDDMPSIPGVAPDSVATVSDGGAVAAVVVEQPANTSAAEIVVNTSIRDKMHPFELISASEAVDRSPRDRAAGYTWSKPCHLGRRNRFESEVAARKCKKQSQ
jgi:hypothetical protein